MLRAALKGIALACFGHAPGGPRAYRSLTREHLGTYGTHVDKLGRVWPGYVRVWRELCGLEIEGLRIWVHEAGETPFAPFAAYLLTGAGGVATNSQGRVLDRYLARAVNGALASRLEGVPADRRARLEPLRWTSTAAEAAAAVGGRLLDGVRPDRVPLADGSIDLCHSGGALEHYPPRLLEAFLAESFRILRPGGVASHVLDNRDHLHHADARYPFLGHLALDERVYRVLCGHPLLYHNRLRPADVSARLEAVGFERIAVRRMVLPARTYVDTEAEAAARGTSGLPRWLLARRYRDVSDADLRTAATHFLYRKPRRPRVG